MGFLLGVGLLIAGIFLLVFAGFLFLTIILIPLAIVAGIIGVIILIAGIVSAAARTTYHAYHHHTHPGQVKYCPGCGIPSAVENKYCRDCGTKFLEDIL
jgi:hypothetical protein